MNIGVKNISSRPTPTVLWYFDHASKAIVSAVTGQRFAVEDIAAAGWNTKGLELLPSIDGPRIVSR